MYPYNLGNLLNRKDDKLAIVQDRSYTFKDVDDLATSFSNGLRQRGIKKGDRVAVLSENSINLIASYLGILRIGAVAVLISARLPQESIEYIVNDSQSKIVLDEKNFNDYLASGPDLIEHMAEDDPAIILYTSGSTSKPKGVIVPHRHLWTLKEKTTFDFWPKVRMFVAAPMYHMNGLSNIEVCLCSGATAYLMIKFDPVKAIDIILEHRINYISSVPTMMSLLLKELKDQDLSCVKHVAMGSAPVSRSLFRSVKARIPSAGVSIAYGSTEIGPGIFGFHKTKPTPELSVGCRIPGIDYRIVDGILQIRSPSMMLRYNNISTNFTDDNFFITNDLFREDENGFFYFVGRADDMFVCGGNNVYPRHIESILEEHQSVREAAVIGIEDEVKGMKPYAFITLTNDVTIEELKEFSLKKLPAYLCPREIWAIQNMPLNSVHKIDKKKLKEQSINLLYNI